MAGIKIHQKLPNNWEEREDLREKGQFWTPEWVAEAMVEYVIGDSQLVFDPAVGKGAFYNALKNIQPSDQEIEFYGTDVDASVLKERFPEEYPCNLELRDFIFSPPKSKFKSIVANPPYIRHHRLPIKTKNKLRKITKKILGFTIDGRAGLHVYFLIQALNLLEPKGKLAFIMPADTCEGIFAEKLWNWITQKFCLECVITFSSEATPFPRVDTNAIVFLIKNDRSSNKFHWVLSKKAYSSDLKSFIKSNFEKSNFSTLEIIHRHLNEALKTGLSRPPLLTNFNYRLGDFARVMRGIATGANKFFCLTKEQAEKLTIPEEFLKPTLGRTRDVEGSYVTNETLKNLDKKGRPTLLFSPDGRELEKFPEKVQNYILYGEKLGLNKKTLIKTRRPWYKMEQREIPKFLFAYLGRRNARFIKNEANIAPLTGFLCVYPHSYNKIYIKKLWEILSHPDTVKNLRLVGKSYGSGAIKVEPRALENLPIPQYLVEKHNLKPVKKSLFNSNSPSQKHPKFLL